MKIPTDKDVNADWESAWYIAAANVTMETGVFVEVRKDYGKYPGTSGYPASANFSKLARIYFVVDGHEFETLTDLRKAIANKAFL